MSHRNARLSYEARLRLVQRCQHRPIAHVAAEMGVSRACASKWVNRWRRHGELGLHDRPSVPHHSPRADSAGGDHPDRDLAAGAEVVRLSRSPTSWPTSASRSTAAP